MKVNKIKITYLSVIYAGESLIKAILPLFFVNIFNYIVKKEYKMAMILLVIQLMGYIMYVIYNNVLNNTDAKIKEEIKNEIKYNLALKINDQKAKDIDKNKVLSWTINDVEDIINNYIGGICEIVGCISLIVFSVITLVYYSYILFLACVILSIFTYYIPQLFVKTLEKKQKDLNTAEGIYLKKIKNILYGIMNFIYSNKQNNFIFAIDRTSTKLKEEYLKTFKFNKKYNVFINFVIALSNVILYAIVYIMIYYNYVSLGLFTAITDVFNNFNQSIISFSSLIAKIKVGKSILNKFDKELVCDLVEKKDAKKIDNITFDDFGLNFQERTIIKNFSFKINKDEKYIILGKSGSGKSSLIKSILGLITYDGVIKINDEDINTFNMKSIYNNITYISDENKIIYANIYDNIALFSKYDKKKMDEILKILKLEHIDKDKILDESILSTGEIQRINLARVLYNQKNILILDEALANIDAENRSNIIEYINSKPLTLLYITHHIDDNIKYDYKLKIPNLN